MAKETDTLIKEFEQNVYEGLLKDIYVDENVLEYNKVR